MSNLPSHSGLFKRCSVTVDLPVSCCHPCPLQKNFHLSEEVCRAHRHLVSTARKRATEKEEDEEEEKEDRLCDFGQWAEFQAAPDSIRLVPHSQWTKMYLTTLELMDVMQQGSSDAGTNYEMEMRTFLNKDDVSTSLLPPRGGGDKREGVQPALSKCRGRRAAILSDEEDEDFMPAKKQLSLDSESTAGSAKSAGMYCDPVSPIEKEMESSSIQVGLSGTPPQGLPSSSTDGGPIAYDHEGSSPSDGGEGAATDVPLPPSFSELDWLDSVAPSQQRSHSVAWSVVDSSPRKMTSTPLKDSPLPSLQDRSGVHRETLAFTAERGALVAGDFKVPPAVSRRSSLSPSVQHMVLISPELPCEGVKEKCVEKGDGKAEGNTSTSSASVPISAVGENLSTTVSCEHSADNSIETDCEQVCDDVNLVGDSDIEEDGINDPSASILLCTSPFVDKGVVRGTVLSPKSPALLSPPFVPSHTGGGEVSVSLPEESPLNFNHRKRGKRMHSRRNMLLSQFSPSPKREENQTCGAPGSTPIARKKKCHIVISDEGSDGDFEAPLRKPEKRARAHFGKSDEDSQVEEPTAFPVAVSVDKEEDMIEYSSDDSAENWQKCERKLSKKVTNDFLVDEAELSADSIVQYSSDESDDPDAYDCKDSFINDTTLLTQVTPKGKKSRKTCRGKPSPNMMGMYRRFLRSPNDVLFGGGAPRDGVRAGRCRMVLSQRHGVLRKYAKKAGFKVPFVSPNQTVAPSSSAEDISETLSQDMDESSEAEEVQMMHYGEEEEEEEDEEMEEEGNEGVEDEEMEEEGNEGVEDETQDPDELAEEVAACVAEEASALALDADKDGQVPEGTDPTAAELPSYSVSFARREEGMEQAMVCEDQLYHEVLDDLLADNSPAEYCVSPPPSSTGLPDAGSSGAPRDTHCLQPTAKQQSQVEQRICGDMDGTGGGRVGEFPKFRILRPGARSYGEHTENVLTSSYEAPPGGAVGPGVVVRTGGEGGWSRECLGVSG